MQFTILTETIMYLVLTSPPQKKKKKFHISIVFDFLRQLWYPGEIGNNGYANIFLRGGGGWGKQGALWSMWRWRIQKLRSFECMHMYTPCMC